MSQKPLDSTNIYTWEQVGKHKELEDCWVVIGNNVYNLTSYASQHPGGPIVLAGRAGKNASINFEQVVHSKNAIESIMPKFKIGTVDNNSLMEQWQKQIPPASPGILITILVILVLLIAAYHLFG